MVMSLQMVMFAYGGIEIIGIPPVKRKILRNRYRVRLTPCHAYSGVLRRYAVRHYVYLPVNQVGTAGSPFVLTFQHMGITLPPAFLTLLC